MPETSIRYSETEGRKSALIVLTQDHVGLSDNENLNEIIKAEILNGVKDFTFDLSSLKTLNSAGIGIIIGCRNAIKSGGGDLKLENVNDRITDIFRLTKIDSLFGFNK